MLTFKKIVTFEATFFYSYYLLAIIYETFIFFIYCSHSYSSFFIF